MLTNRVRFGNMKRVNRAVWALTVILMMVLGLVLAGCSGSSDGADGKEESTYSKIVAIAKKGRSLADVKDELKDAVTQATKEAFGAQGKAPDTPQPPPPDPQTRFTPEAPAAQPAASRPARSPWATFPYPVLCVIIFLAIGFIFGWWHPGWVIFLTIPIYYWIVRVVEDDPNWRSSHENRNGKV